MPGRLIPKSKTLKRTRRSASAFVDAARANARRALDGFDDAKNLRWAKGAVVLNEARGEVDYAERTGGSFETRLQDIGVIDVGLFANFAIGGTYEEPAALFFIEQRGKYRLRIEPRQTAPDDFAVMIDQCG